MSSVRSGLASFLAAAVLASAPVQHVLAQTTPAAEPAAAPAPPPAPAPAPAKPAGITFTPYGFALLNAYFDGGPFAARDYPGQAVPAGNEGGAFLMSARQSRFGFKIGLPEEGWTGAKVDLLLEADFKAGHLPTSATCSAVPAGGGTPTCTIGTANTASSAWYNGVVRLRQAYGTAAWKTSYGTWTLLAGQAYGLVNPLFATAIAWTADPLFWQAGNLWRRSPQVRLSYGNNFDAFGLTLDVAALSPADGTTPVDFGAGNRSRMPDLEGRLGLSYKVDKKTTFAVGVSTHYNKRRYALSGSQGDFDATEAVSGFDFDFNVPYVEVKGEGFTARGADDTYAGIAPGVNLFGTAAAGFFARTVATKGGWAQLVLTPIPELNLYGGYGVEVADAKDLAGGNAPATARSQNNMTAFGVIVNASKAWKIALEGMNTISFTKGGTRAEGKQFAVSTKFDF